METVLKKNLPNIEASARFATHFYNDFLKDKGAFTIFFEGGLGAGKTFLIRSLLEQYGVRDNIGSPTYLLLQEYHSDGNHLAHFDFYRLKEPSEFLARGFEEVATNKNISKLVEWPEKLSPELRKLFSGKKYVVKLGYGVGVGMRTVRLLTDNDD